MEQKIIIWLQAHSSKFWDLFFTAHSHLVSWIGVVFFLLVIFLFINKKFALFYGMGFGVTIGINYLIKIIVSRPRPYLVNGQIINKLSTIGYSFPSGHSVSTMFMVLIFITLFSYLRNQKRYNLFNKTWFKVLVVALSVIALITTAFARMYLGQHYLTDVLAGYVVGFVGFTITNILYKSLLKLRKRTD